MIRIWHTRVVTAILAGLFLTQVGTAQGPKPQGTSHPSATHNAKLDNAVKIAKDIAAARDKETQEAVKAWEKARKDGRVVIIENAPPSVRGFTWPDAPDPPILGPAGSGNNAPQGEYMMSQTMLQFTGISAESMTKCDCVVAILIIHEGRRLDQSGPSSSGDPTNWDAAATMTSNDQQLYLNDIKDIDAALPPNGICAPMDVDCETELRTMREIAQTRMRAANANAAACRANGRNVPHDNVPN